MPTGDSHYFDEQPSVDSAPKQVDLWLPDMHLALSTDRGVFGRGQVDSGTRALLQRVPAPPSTGLLADVGCGTGAIAITLAKRSPGATVLAVDVNRRALELCAENAAANDAPNVVPMHPDDVPGDLVLGGWWSNPPIRIGKAALHELLTTWLARLAPGGEAWMVVHKHLGSDSLQAWLTRQGYPTTRHSSVSGYRILCARHADAGSASIPGA